MLGLGIGGTLKIYDPFIPNIWDDTDIWVDADTWYDNNIPAYLWDDTKNWVDSDTWWE